MNKLISVISIIWILASCDSSSQTHAEIIDNSTIKTQLTNLASDTIPKVTGIGGVFFFANNPEQTKEWYTTN